MMRGEQALLLMACLAIAAGRLVAAQGDVPDDAPSEGSEEPEVDPCGKEALVDYRLGLHIGSVFILLGTSLLGAFLPVVLHITSKNSITQTFVKFGTFFGFGSILSTAFIHMMLPAVENLSSECLPESWTGTYEAWPYLFVVIAILMMQLIDFLVETAYVHYTSKNVDLHGAITHIHGSREHVHECSNTAIPGSSESGSQAQDEEAGTAECAVHGTGCQSLLHEKADPSQIIGIYLMEAGIVFHSVLIGITLGVTAGAAFTTLLLALAFHQCFEGFAIGSAAVDSGLSTKKAFAMGLVYSLTTPIGIAVGIAIRSSFNGNSTRTLMVEGIFDSISTGILIYVVLVELINPMMTQSKWLRQQKWWIKLLSFVSLYAGATVMAVIGKWV